MTVTGARKNPQAIFVEELLGVAPIQTLMLCSLPLLENAVKPFADVLRSDVCCDQL